MSPIFTSHVTIGACAGAEFTSRWIPHSSLFHRVRPPPSPPLTRPPLHTYATHTYKRTHMTTSQYVLFHWVHSPPIFPLTHTHTHKRTHKHSSICPSSTGYAYKRTLPPPTTHKHTPHTHARMHVSTSKLTFINLFCQQKTTGARERLELYIM